VTWLAAARPKPREGGGPARPTATGYRLPTTGYGLRAAAQMLEIQNGPRAGIRLRFGHWNFEFVWSLVLAIWNFHARSAGRRSTAADTVPIYRDGTRPQT